MRNFQILNPENNAEISAKLKERLNVSHEKEFTDYIFVLSQDDSLEPKELFEKNVRHLESICKHFYETAKNIILYSPNEHRWPQNAYELSVIIAEDLVRKYNKNNQVCRDISHLFHPTCE